MELLDFLTQGFAQVIDLLGDLTVLRAGLCRCRLAADVDSLTRLPLDNAVVLQL